MLPRPTRCVLRAEDASKCVCAPQTPSFIWGEGMERGIERERKGKERKGMEREGRGMEVRGSLRNWL